MIWGIFKQELAEDREDTEDRENAIEKHPKEGEGA